MKTVRWYKFWNPGSGFIGGVVFGLLIDATIIGFAFFMSR